ARIAAQFAGAPGSASTNLLVDTLTNPGGMPEGYFFPSAPGGAIFFQYARNTPAFSLANVFSDAGRAFLPSDTHANIDKARKDLVSVFALDLARAMLNDERLTASSELPPTPFQQLWSVRIQAAEFDRFSANVLPTVPVAGAAIILHDNGATSAGPDVEGAFISLTDERASAIFYGINKVTTRAPMFTTALHLDPDFVSVDRAIDAGEAHDRVNSNLARIDQLVLSLFPCTEFPVLDRADPSLVSAAPIQATSYIVLDAGLNNSPKRYGASGISLAASGKKFPPMAGPAAVYVEPGSLLKLMTASSRLVLNASPVDPEGAGFSSPSAMGPDFFLDAARDMKVLNESRSRSLRGTSDRLAEEFMQTCRSRLEGALRARQDNDHIAYLGSLHEALGAGVKAYQQTSSMRNDMLKAVVLYLALLLPFCFFVQRLLFSTTRVELQMLLFVILFAATYMLFRLIHPAFAIARSPEAIFIAFVMGALGLFVIYILHGRFEGEMQLLFNRLSGGEKIGASHSSAGQQAMMIGVNNMKRRRIRTTLTTATVVLVTFTMLAFSSISTRLSPTVIAKAPLAPYTGLMYHWPGRTMDESSLQVLGEMFHGFGRTLVRRWLVAPRTELYAEQLILPFHATCSLTGSQAGIEAVLGLSPAEDGFVDGISMSAGRFFMADDALEVILPASVARVLNISTGNISNATIVLNGREFRVAGVIRDEYIRIMRDLDQNPILPVKSTPRRTSIESPTASDKDAVPMTDEETAGVTYFDTSTILLMPVETCRRLGGQPYSISVKLDDNTAIWPFVSRLLTVSSARFYVASRKTFETGAGSPRRDAGVYYVGSGYRTSIGGLSRLLIPLLIAGTILLNTMLGSVYERKREIAIYNAIGLNPTHIGLFFLSEAFVYAVIGSVGGYLVGQTSALALAGAGILGPVSLNFSSMTVGYVILFTISVVLLSTIYPAIMASRAAVPSGRRTWSMPDHDGQTMKTTFPFIYPPQSLGGVMRYLREYFTGFSEASIGNAIAELKESIREKDPAGNESFTLRYHVVLPPYDLGVTQAVTLGGAYDERLGFCRITVTIVRVSGQDTNWASVNRPFLEKLRRYLMNWRNLDSKVQAQYLAASGNVDG
ncbi:MAG: hypothetical protein C0404_04620, partial [Verrucomicrobia bacterium]|nr:hypothetical protein [Verrucomicrobiota bacterium]